MNVFIQGVGAVTPLAPDAEELFNALLRGERAELKPIPHSLNNNSYLSCLIPQAYTDAIAKQPRLRRSGLISLEGAAAALEAIKNAGLKIGDTWSARTAIVFAICSGGVNYTRRFYREIVEQGAQAASPLLFPDTVYNAPAAHLSAILGITGKNYTMVGDSSVGLSAIHYAIQLLAMDPQLEHCIVVGTEEADWLLGEAFASWRLARRDKSFEVFGRLTGAFFADGAGALILGREGKVQIVTSSAGEIFFSKRDAIEAAPTFFSNLLNEVVPDFAIASANGTFIDRVEEAFFKSIRTPVYAPKSAIGDALGASAIIHTVLAVHALEKQRLPGTLDGGDRLISLCRQSRDLPDVNYGLVTAIGFDEQVNGLVLKKGREI